jgi:hypothetical protein
VRLHPADSPRPTGSHAEQAVHRALKACRLPCHAFHSLRLRSRGGWEGEGDFVLADPSAGFLVLEVKGGHIELPDGRWWQNGQPMKRSPRDQGNGFARRLQEELRRAGLGALPFGVATVFPDCEFSAPPSCGDLRGVQR